MPSCRLGIAAGSARGTGRALGSTPDHQASAELGQGLHSKPCLPAQAQPCIRALELGSVFGQLEHRSQPRRAGVGDSRLPCSALTSVKMCFI